jgi:redox-sensitive bicupin YhaK (pirin superfamily)
VAAQAGWEILVLGGVPIREQVARYGPFVMNTREEIMHAIKDFNEGRMGTIPPRRVPHGTSEDQSM